ncbi:MAG TPA: nucleotide exchange factor GrpE, partial [Candidatus Paceibacterota bacterium]|nr:nucleotide exchange factor GrpE [Candidatus Paceibacterota bacterium]
AFEPEDNETPLSSFGKSKGDALAELKEKLKASEAKAAEYLTDLQRMKAEFVNLRKRDEDEKKELVKYSNEKLILELLPVLDSFEMAFANKEAWEKADKNWRVGVEYIHSQLVGIFEKHGVRTIDPLGEKFDPARDTPVEMVSTENESDDHKIIAVMQKGYSLNGKEIRSPKVKVAEYKPAA